MNFHTLALCVLEMIKTWSSNVASLAQEGRKGILQCSKLKEAGILLEFIKAGRDVSTGSPRKAVNPQGENPLAVSQRGKLPVHPCLHLQEGCWEDRWVSYHPLPYAEASSEEATPRLHPQGFDSACKWSQMGATANHILCAFFLVSVHMSRKGGLKGLREKVW